MLLPPQSSLRAVFLVTVAVFASVAIYLYGFRFFAWAESDAAVTVLLAGKILSAKRPIVDTWYYANGDVWFLAPQVLALLPVAILGIGPATLLISVVAGFLLELIVLVREYSRLCSERWLAAFAAVVTLMAWSLHHVAYVYIQLGYGFTAVVYLVLFGLVARLAEHGSPRLGSWLAAGGLLFVFGVQNPTRALVFMVAPFLVACIWPWDAMKPRRRIALGVAVTGGMVVAWVVYALVFARIVQFSVPRGHNDFVIAGLHGIGMNVAQLARGLVSMCGGDDGVLWAVPGIVVTAGAVVLVTSEAVASRVLNPLRFLCVVTIAQLLLVCGPLVIGNLLVDIGSVRYLMPSLLTIFGLAAILAVRAVGAVTLGWRRSLAAVWLGAVPIAALAGARDAPPPEPRHYQWPDLPELSEIADELVRRKLTHGFANVLGANVLNLESRGATLACPVYFREFIMPQRWLADTTCYRAAAIPSQFYIVIDQTEHDATALRNTLPATTNRFRVGTTYEVVVFQTADVAMQWLDLPIIDGADAQFPMQIAATHLQIRRGHAVVAGNALVATGESGTVVYGPYVALPKGRYELIWVGRALDAAGRLAFSVRAHGGAEVLAQVEAYAKDLPRDSAELPRIAFRLDSPRDGLEFLVESGGGGRVELQHLIVRRR